MSDELREALDRLPRLRITGEQLDAIDPDPEKVFYTDWDEWDEYVRLDAVRAALSEEAAVPLDVERLERVLRYIHGNSVPFPVRRTPEEYAAFIVECDARLTADTPSSDTPERRCRRGGDPTMSDKLRKALENAISVIESVRESGAVDADDLLWLDRECAAAANAGYIALAARHDSLGRELSANYDDDPAHYLPGDYIARRECGGACHDHTLAAVIDTLTRLRDGS